MYNIPSHDKLTRCACGFHQTPMAPPPAHCGRAGSASLSQLRQTGVADRRFPGCVPGPLVGGIPGTWAAGVFASKGLGVFQRTRFRRRRYLHSRQMGADTTFAHRVAIPFVLLKVVNTTVGLRTTAEEETRDLDITQHEERRYVL